MKRWGRKLAWALLTVVIILLMGEFSASFWGRKLLLAKANTNWGLEMEVKKFIFFPFPGLVRMEGVSIKGNSSPPREFLQVKKIIIRLKILPLLRREFLISQILLHRPRLILEKDEKGKINFPFPGEPPSEGKRGNPSSNSPPRERGFFRFFRIDEIIVQEGEIEFVARRLSSLQRRIKLVNFDASLTDLIYPMPSGKMYTSFEIRGDVPSDPRGRIRVSGKGNLLGSSKDFLLTSKLEDIYIPHFSPLFPRNLPLQIVKGTFSLNSEGKCEKNILKIFNRAKVKNLKISSPQGEGTSPFLPFINPLGKGRDFSFEFQITGDIKHPQFDFSPAFQKGFFSIITRSKTDEVR